MEGVSNLRWLNTIPLIGVGNISKRCKKLKSRAVSLVYFSQVLCGWRVSKRVFVRVFTVKHLLREFVSCQCSGKQKALAKLTAE